MITIPLTQGYRTIIDDVDAELAAFKWYALVTGSGGAYAARKSSMLEGPRRIILLHRVILGIVDPKMMGDHMNGDTLNNCRSNLRAVSSSENQRNLSPIGKSGRPRGVVPSRNRKRWKAQIVSDGMCNYLGTFDTIEEAAAARLAAELEIWKEIPPRRAI